MNERDNHEPELFCSPSRHQPVKTEEVNHESLHKFLPEHLNQVGLIDCSAKTLQPISE